MSKLLINLSSLLRDMFVTCLISPISPRNVILRFHQFGLQLKMLFFFKMFAAQ